LDQQAHNIIKTLFWAWRGEFKMGLSPFK